MIPEVNNILFFVELNMQKLNLVIINYFIFYPHSLLNSSTFFKMIT